MSTTFDNLFKKKVRHIHTMPGIPFVKRYINRTDPDSNEYMFERAMGEFSIHADIAFERHLRKLREIFKHE